MKNLCLLFAALSAIPLVAGAEPKDKAPEATVAQGGLARWSGLAARSCGLHGLRYPAVDSTCYFPIDVLADPGRYQAAVYDADGKEHLGWLTVEARDCAEESIVLDDPRYAEPKGEDLARHQRERKEVLAVLQAVGEDPTFSLPLAAPTAKLSGSGDDFCARRYFNGDDEESLHTGRDYKVSLGTALLAPEAGTVKIAGDHFMTGRSVYIDHGGGLISELFHLSDVAVAAGDQVERGQRVGASGESGRATGPHLHFGVRWLNHRIDPALLLGNRNSLPDLGANAK